MTADPTPDRMRELLDDSVRRKLAETLSEITYLEQVVADYRDPFDIDLLAQYRQELASLEAIAARRGIDLSTPGAP